MGHILVVDCSLYTESIVKGLREEGHIVHVSGSAYDAIAKMNINDYDLVISEVELPGDNSFDLYYYIKQHYPYIPTIMTTDKNIDNFFDKIFEQGIGNVLCKPIRKSELNRLVEKLITHENVFGLKNYLTDYHEIKKIRITSSYQIPKAIDMIMDHIRRWGYDIRDRIALTLVLHEMTINAVYHSHGYTKEKESRVQVTLPEGQFVDLFFGHNKRSYGISIVDYNGKLSKTKILSSINKVIEQDQIIQRAISTGVIDDNMISETGRGIDLVRKLSGEYYFIIKKDKQTEIILIFDTSNDLGEDDGTHTSLKIIEDVIE